MSGLGKFILFIFWGGLVPVFCGLFPASFLPKERRRLHLIIMSGFLSCFSLCEVIGLPVLFLTPTGNFRLLLILYLAGSAAWIAAGLIRCARTGGIQAPLAFSAAVKDWKKRRSSKRTGEAAGPRESAAAGVSDPCKAGSAGVSDPCKAGSAGVSDPRRSASTGVEKNTVQGTGSDEKQIQKNKPAGGKLLWGQITMEEAVFWCIYAALLCFQLIMAYRLASYDGDDAYYVAQSVQTWQTGTMYHYIPYTGVTTALDGRHAMAMMPMWITIISVLCRTHPTIVTHSMIPLVFIPLADVCFYSLICAMLYDKVSRKRKRRMLAAFMVVLAVLQIFGNVSIYTPETFLLLRTWQGKTVFAVVIVPCVYTVLLHLSHRLTRGESVGGTLFAALLVNMASGLCTALAPFLTLALFLLGGVFIALACHTRKGLTLLLPTCIPNLIYAAILLRIMLPVLLS